MGLHTKKAKDPKETNTMTNVEKLKARQAEELAKAEIQDAIIASLPQSVNDPRHVMIHKDHIGLTYGNLRYYSQGYQIPDVEELLKQFPPVECPHYRSGSLSTWPEAINGNAKRQDAKYEDQHAVEMACSGNVEPGHSYGPDLRLEWWTERDGRLLHIQAELPARQLVTFRYHDRNHRPISGSKTPQFIGEEYRISWGTGSEYGYRVSYYWRSLESFTEWYEGGGLVMKENLADLRAKAEAQTTKD